jgi:Ca-activated chloride channel family protein
MAAQHILLTASIAVLALAACGKKAEPVDTAAPPGPAAAEAGAPVLVNEGEPVDGDVTLTVPATAAAGSEFAPVFTGPANAGDYIDIVPRGSTNTSGELAYIYIRAAASGQKLRAVTQPGEYDVRYVMDIKGERKIKAVQPLTITPVTATLTLPATASGGEPLSIEWSGPGGQGDYIDIVPAGFEAISGEIAYAYTSSGNPAKFSSPGAAGEYQIRYVLEGPGGRQVLASSPLTVSAATATLTAPDSADKGETVIVAYEGPKRSGDYVDLVKKDFVATSGELTYFYANGTAPNSLKLPAEPGTYDIRYVMEAPDGRVVLAKHSIEVK